MTTKNREAQMQKQTVRFSDETYFRLLALIFVRKMERGKPGEVTLNSVVNDAVENYLRDHGLPADEEKTILGIIKRQGGL